jgi:hypothetical protein
MAKLFSAYRALTFDFLLCIDFSFGICILIEEHPKLCLLIKFEKVLDSGKTVICRLVHILKVENLHMV